MEIDIKRLVMKLHMERAETRNNAAKALIEIGEKAVPALIHTLDESWSEQARAAAAFALGQIGSPHAVPALIRALELGACDTPTSVSEVAVKALQSIGTEEAKHAVRLFHELHND